MAIGTEGRLCGRQCRGCAFKSGAAANREVSNKLKGILAALSGTPFWCHESLGWTHDKDGYPSGTHANLILLCDPKTRKAIVQAGMNPATMDENIEQIRSSLYVCGGWRSAVGRLKDSRWFANRDVNLVRREFAKSGIRDLNEMASSVKELRRARLKSLNQVVRWFMNEARESGVKIGWLVK